MLKTMMFIDGTWLQHRIQEFEQYTNFEFDYEGMPNVVVNELKKQVVPSNLDMVRVLYFGSYPASYDPNEKDISLPMKNFYSFLSDNYQYDIDAYPRMMKKVEDNEGASFDTREKFVDVALATSMLYYAAIPDAYDIAIAVIGDKDYLPALKRIRDLGKRVAIVSVKNRCPAEYYEPGERTKIKDFKIIWLDEIIQKINIANSQRALNDLHEGQTLIGKIIQKKENARYAFISVHGLNDNFYFASADVEGTEFNELKDDDVVYFDVMDLKPLQVPNKSPIAGRICKRSIREQKQNLIGRNDEFSRLFKDSGILNMVDGINKRFLDGKGKITKTYREITLVGVVPNTNKGIELSIKSINERLVEINGNICRLEFPKIAGELKYYLHKIGLLN